ncbi:sodium:melibiose symporter [Verrucomicrobia bacterium IMCC26134]|nr:sodium:melibiose symporter [Verrucomicrobia bacterium IMCC26134]
MIGCAMGGIPMNIGIEGVKSLAGPIYNVLLGVNPALIGSMLMIARLWDAVCDVIMGSISDNTRTRWGRRRPFIFVGAILGAICYPLIWFVPQSFSHEAAAVYFLCSVLLFYSVFTIFYVPFFTLTLELTPNYSQRTKVSGTLLLFGAIATLAITWAFRAAQSDIFPNAFIGIRTVGIVFGAAFLIFGLMPAIFGRERFQAQIANQPKQKILTNLKVALGAKPFRILMGMTVLIILGVMSFNSLGLYVNIYYVFGGDTKLAATLAGMTGTINFALAWVFVPLITKFAKKWGKERVLSLCLIAGICTGLTKWLLYTPAHPYLQLFDPIISILPNFGFWVLVNAMKADICDWDELQSGMRREGAFASASTWLQKFSSALTFSLTGLFLVLIGFQQSLGGHQPPETISALRLGFILSPVIVYSLALLILRTYPLTPARMGEIRATLEARRGQI